MILWLIIRTNTKMTLLIRIWGFTQHFWNQIQSTSLTCNVPKIPINASHKFRATITILIVKGLFSFTSRAMFASLECQVKVYINVWFGIAWFRLEWFTCNMTVSVTCLKVSVCFWNTVYLPCFHIPSLNAESEW